MSQLVASVLGGRLRALGLRHVTWLCASGLVGSLCLVVAVALLVSAPALAQDAEGPELTEAQAALLVDSEGNVLFSKNPEQEIAMASITKVMTAVVALESGKDLDAAYQLQGVSLPEEAIIAGYKEGMSSTLRDLLRVMLVKSANDAASEVAIAVAGSEDAFVQMMNDKAQALGMSHTHFMNPHGLDAEGHYSCVQDLVKLGRYALTRHPFIAETVQLGEVSAPVGELMASFETTDEFLLEYPGALGIKTGVGDSATSFLGCARRDGTTLYSCVLGCTTKEGRFTDTEALFDWAWGTYRHYELAGANSAQLVPFAYHFGLSCVSAADATTPGLVWPQGGATTFQRIMTVPRTYSVPSSALGVCQWRQDGRTVGTASYSTAPVLAPSYSGFGLLDCSRYIQERLSDAA